MRAHIFAGVCFLLMSGCDMEDGDCAAKSEVHNEAKADLRRESVAAIDERQPESIMITDVVLHESGGGYYE